MQLDLDLENPCENCNEDGGWIEHKTQQWKECSVCNGTGFETTIMGDRILELVERHAKTILRKVVQELKTTDAS